LVDPLFVVPTPLQLSFYNHATGTGTDVSCVFDESATLVFTVPSATCWAL
jgi:hypothetical protein